MVENSLIQKWGRAQLGIEDDSVEVAIEDDSNVTQYGGCPTCGPEYEVDYSVTITTIPYDYYKVATRQFSGLGDAIETIMKEAQEL